MDNMGLYNALYGSQMAPTPQFFVDGMNPYAGQSQMLGSGRPLTAQELKLQRIDDNDYRLNQMKPAHLRRPLNRGMLETMQRTR